MIDLVSPEVKFAIEAVRQASLIIQQVQAELVSPALTKEDRSPVTVADYASQALVGYLLNKTFPQDPLVAEEDSAKLRSPTAARVLDQVTFFVRQHVPQATPGDVCNWIDHGRTNSAPRFWTLDPIDGTKGFLRGDQYVVAFALVVESQVQVGALGCPNLVEAHRPEAGGPGSLVIAVRGQGTWTTSLASMAKFTRLSASSQTNPSQARILRSFEPGHTSVCGIDAFVQALGTPIKPIRMDSQAKYAVLAAGKGDLLLRLLSPSKPNYREKIWDQAAGSMLLEEAGGCITDLDGKPLDFSTGRALIHNRGILASNGHLHTVACKILGEIGA